MEIIHGKEKSFLSPLSVMKIPLIGKKTGQALIDMGVRRVKTLRKIPKEMLERIFGKMGTVMWKRARGIDDSPVVPYSEAKSVSTESTFRQDTIDVKGLRATIARMAEKLAFRIREKGRMTACITVKVRYSNFDTTTKQRRIAYTSSDSALAGKALDLFDELYNRRLLVRLVGIRLSDFVPGGYQANLFEDSEEQLRLHQAIDNIKHRFGAGIIMRGNAVGSIGR